MTGAAEDTTLDFTVVAGDPTPAELAAVTAVLGALVEEQGAADRRAARRGPDAWARSQRPIRGSIVPGSGAWRGFSA